MATSISFARVGELACQRNPFLRELCVRTVSCEPVTTNKPAGSGKGCGDGSMASKTSYNTVFTDSVLFPEGGGQPCDYGSLICGDKEISVQKVQRSGDMCVVTTPCPLEIGEEVRMCVDWPRRLDHMQHHSAQHLLSAVVVNSERCGWPTVSWSLTHPYSFIVLPTGKKIEADVLEQLEAACNDAIARAVPVRCDTFANKEAYDQALLKETEEAGAGSTVRKSRAIPVDVTGPIRIITIESGIDSNTCCGTHVSNLAQLQMIKLLHQETKGDTLKLFFVTGDRLRRYYGEMYFRERELMKELGGVRPEGFVEAAVKKGKQCAATEKQLKNLALELMKVESEKLIAEAKALGVGAGNGAVAYRRDDVDVEFFNALRNTFLQACPDSLAVFAWATTPTGKAVKGVMSGQFMIVGPAERVQAAGPFVCSALAGKGGMSKLGYRGSGDLAGWADLVVRLRSI